MDINVKLQLANALAVIETLGRELPTQETLELYRQLGTRQNTIRTRLSREGAFQTKPSLNQGVVVLSAIEARVG